MGYIIGLAIAILLPAIFLPIHLYCEMRDQEYRREHGLPPVKYHDVSDWDTFTVIQISHGTPATPHNHFDRRATRLNHSSHTGRHYR